MNAACPTCGQMALPASRYCRACYTIFPTPKMTAALPRPRTEARALQLLFLIALAAGGWWAYRADTAESPGGASGWSERAGERGSGGGFGPSTRSGGADAGPSARPARAASSARPPAPEAVVQLDPVRLCGSGGECEVTVRFVSGEAARFAVSRHGASASALVPLDGDGHILLGRHGRAVVTAAGGEQAIAIVRLAGRRWISLGGA